MVISAGSPRLIPKGVIDLISGGSAQAGAARARPSATARAVVGRDMVAAPRDRGIGPDRSGQGEAGAPGAGSANLAGARIFNRRMVPGGCQGGGRWRSGMAKGRWQMAEG